MEKRGPGYAQRPAQIPEAGTRESDQAMPPVVGDPAPGEHRRLRQPGQRPPALHRRVADQRGMHPPAAERVAGRLIQDLDQIGIPLLIGHPVEPIPGDHDAGVRPAVEYPHLQPYGEPELEERDLLGPHPERAAEGEIGTQMQGRHAARSRREGLGGRETLGDETIEREPGTLGAAMLPQPAQRLRMLRQAEQIGEQVFLPGLAYRAARGRVPGQPRRAAQVRQ